MSQKRFPGAVVTKVTPGVCSHCGSPCMLLPGHKNCQKVACKKGRTKKPA